MRKFLFFALAALTMAGCKQTEYVTVERVLTDTLRVIHNTRDSIYLHDSVYVNQYQRGDTIYVEKEKWHTRYQDRLLRDTIYKSRVDSIPVPYPVEKLVERKLTRWQIFRLGAGDCALVLLFVGLAAVIIRRQFFK